MRQGRYFLNNARWLSAYAITDIHRVPELINDMAKTIDEIGMSPFKF